MPTHWYPTVGCGNMQTGHNTPHTGTQLSDVAICRLVTTHHALVPNRRMRQYADWSQHATHWYPTARCCNMQTGDNTSRTGTQPSDAATCRLVTTRPHIGTLPFISTTPLPQHIINFYTIPIFFKVPDCGSEILAFYKSTFLSITTNLKLIAQLYGQNLTDPPTILHVLRHKV